MEGTLWYVLSGRGEDGTRARIVELLDDRPRTVNQLADRLGLAPTTVRHHLDVLTEERLVEGDGRDYAETYALTDLIEGNRGTVEEVIAATDG